MAQILVVDDDPYIRTLLRVFLQYEGHEVREAGNADEALRAVSTAPPDLVLCELFLNGRDGPETIRSLCQMSPRSPVIAMIGSTSGLPPADAGVLCKPFSRQTVLKTVRRALASRVPSVV